MLLLGTIESCIHCAGPLALWGISNIFLQNIGEDLAKSYHLSTEPQALSDMVNPALIVTFT